MKDSARRRVSEMYFVKCLLISQRPGQYHSLEKLRITLSPSMDAFLSQYGLLKRLRELLEPQDYINLLRSRSKECRHKADRTDVKYCLNIANFLFKNIDAVETWRRLYNCSFILYGRSVARLHDYLVGDLQEIDDFYEIVLLLVFEDLESYQQALVDTISGVIGDIHEEIRCSIREKVLLLPSDTDNTHAAVVQLQLDLQVSDVESMSFFKEDRSTTAAWTTCDSTPAIFVCSHAAEPFLCRQQLVPIFPSQTTSVLLLGTLDNPSFIAVKKCHTCSQSDDMAANI